MKKQYSAPVAETIKLQLTQVLCESIPSGGNGNGQPAESNKKEEDFAWSVEN